MREKVSKDGPPSSWSRHVAPDGSYFWFNEQTNETSFQDPLTKSKHTTSKHHEVAVVQVPWSGPWKLVVTKKGRHYFYNVETRQAVWETPASDDAAPEVDRNLLLRLIGCAKIVTLIKDAGGAELEAGRPIPKHLASILTRAAGANKSAKEVDSSVEPSVSDQNAVQGSGAADASEPVLEARDDNEQESDEDWQQHQLEALAEEQATREKSETSSQEFEQLLADYHVDPFSTWETELHKVIEDERYDLLPDNKARSAAFNAWAAKQLENSQTSSHVSKPEKHEDSSLTPTQRFLKLIHNNYKEKYLYVDFKRKMKKTSAFADSSLSEKEKESLFRAYAFTYKLPENDKREAFRKLLRSANVTNGNLPNTVLESPIFIVLDPASKSTMLSEYLSGS